MGREKGMDSFFCTVLTACAIRIRTASVATPMSGPSLRDILAEALPRDLPVNVRHVSTPPTRCDPLFSAAPGADPEVTYCETHFLVVTLNRDSSKVDEEVAVCGFEVLVYTTKRLTTVFVSKADSTGHLRMIYDKHPAAKKGSLIRRIATTFLSFLVRTRRRPGVKTVLCLFARAQNQYLFPGSVDNPGKHVLDDRGLVRWWCRVVDPILREYGVELQAAANASHADDNNNNEADEGSRGTATAYLLVPGCDNYETRAFFPPSAKLDAKDRLRWRIAYPLERICTDVNAPPRCLIPRFPDDPKSRFLIDLDDELPDESSGNVPPEKIGQWRSVKSVDQFWEMMAFRQECSAGRVVGFLWVVIEPPSNERSAQESEEPIHSAFSWPEAGRGEVVLSETDYKKAHSALLEGDFETEDAAITSTMAWVRQVASLADILWWGQAITGRKEEVDEPADPVSAAGTVNTGLNIRKRKKDSESSGETEPRSDPNHPMDTGAVNVLNGSIVRKKKKHD